MSEKMMSQNKLSEFKLVPYNKPPFFWMNNVPLAPSRALLKFVHLMCQK
jgi:hypothetical protein